MTDKAPRIPAPPRVSKSVERRTRAAARRWEDLDGKLMAWAVQVDTGRAVHVMSLTRTGLACGCICAGCGGRLQAVNAGKAAAECVMRPFFRHDVGEQRDRCLTRAAQRAALELLASRDEIVLPECAVFRDVQGVSGDVYTGRAVGRAIRARVRERVWLDEQTAQLTLEDGRVVWLVLQGSHRVSDAGVDGVIRIEVDDPEVATWPAEKILARMTLSPQWFCWEQRWDMDELEASAQSEARRIAEGALDLPAGDLVLAAGLDRLLASESVLHAVLKDILSTVGSLAAPGYTQEISRAAADHSVKQLLVEVPPMTLRLSDVRLECRLEGSVVPDVICRASHVGGEFPDVDLMIEVAVTHPVSEAKKRRIAALGLACLEIDVALMRRGGRMKRATLEHAVRADPSNKRWVWHPHIANLLRERQRELDHWAQDRQEQLRLREARRRWFETADPQLVVPAFLSLLQDRAAGRPALTPDRLAWDPDEVRDILRGRGLAAATGGDPLALLQRLHAIRLTTKHGGARAFDVIQEAYASGDMDRRWVPLLAQAAAVYEAHLGPGERGAVRQLVDEVLTDVAAGNTRWARPSGFDAMIAAVFPELADALAAQEGSYRLAERARDALQALAREERERAAAAEAGRLELLRLERLQQDEAQRRQREEQARQEMLARMRRTAQSYAWRPPVASVATVDAALRLAAGAAAASPERVTSWIRCAWDARAADEDLAAHIDAAGIEDEEQLQSLLGTLTSAWLVEARHLLGGGGMPPPVRAKGRRRR